PTPPPGGPRSPPDRERGARGRSLERLAAGRTATSSFTDAHVRPLRAKFTAAAGSVHESLGRRCRQVGDELARDAVQELNLRGLLLVYAGFHAQREGQGSLALVGQRLAHSIPAAQGLSAATSRRDLCEQALQLDEAAHDGWALAQRLQRGEPPQPRGVLALHRLEGLHQLLPSLRPGEPRAALIRDQREEPVLELLERRLQLRSLRRIRRDHFLPQFESLPPRSAQLPLVHGGPGLPRQGPAPLELGQPALPLVGRGLAQVGGGEDRDERVEQLAVTSAVLLHGRQLPGG